MLPGTMPEGGTCPIAVATPEARGLANGPWPSVRPDRANSSSTPQFAPTDVPTRSAPLRVSAPLEGDEYRLESEWLTRETSAPIAPVTYANCAEIEIPKLS